MTAPPVDVFNIEPAVILVTASVVEVASRVVRFPFCEIVVEAVPPNEA